jgi:hypothetical protein
VVWAEQIDIININNNNSNNRSRTSDDAEKYP